MCQWRELLQFSRLSVSATPSGSVYLRVCVSMNVGVARVIVKGWMYLAGVSPYQRIIEPGHSFE